MVEPKAEVTNLITPIINAFKLASNEWKHLFEIGIAEYLQNQTEKYFFTNTFIHRSEKVRFSEIYYPIKARYKKLTTDFKDLDEVFENYKNITLVGMAGSGKTTLIKYIFLNAINAKKKIPILIELRHLNEYEGDFEKLLTEKILKSRVKPDDATLKKTLRSGSFLFLFDGYDEIFSNKKQEVNRQIELFVDMYSENNFLITTRPGSGVESFPRFHDFRVCQLENTDVDGFLAKIVEEEERRERIIKIIKDPQNKSYLEYLRNPLLLSMFILAFESHPEIPAKKSSFYRNVFDTLYSKHDGITKNSFPREKLTKLQRDEFEKILNTVSYLAFVDGRYSFTEEYLTDLLKKVKSSTDFDYKSEDLIYDLRTTISILILDGFEYHFPHRSMQEYFTAQFITELPTEKKLKAYNNLIKTIEKSSSDNSFNFWSICDELDNTAFTVNYLLPQLKKYEKLLKKQTKQEIVRAFIKITNAALYFQENYSEKTGLVRSGNVFNALIIYCQVFDFNRFWHFPVTSGAIDELDENFIKAKEIVQLRDYPEGLNILLNHGLTDLVLEYVNAISKKIKELEKDIIRKKSNIDDLLNG